jgi:hypothetical protein
MPKKKITAASPAANLPEVAPAPSSAPAAKAAAPKPATRSRRAATGAVRKTTTAATTNKPRARKSTTSAPVAAPAPVPAPVAAPEPTVDLSHYHEEIARLAYHLWEQSGREHGRHEEHWLRAEQEIRARYSERAKAAAAGA